MDRRLHSDLNDQLIFPFLRSAFDTVLILVINKKGKKFSVIDGFTIESVETERFVSFAWRDQEASFCKEVNYRSVSVANNKAKEELFLFLSTNLQWKLWIAKYNIRADSFIRD